MLQWLDESNQPGSSYSHRTVFSLMQKFPLLNKSESLRNWLRAPSARLQGIPAAFEVLDADALPAIPALTDIIANATNPLTTFFASRALVQMGPPAFPAMAGILTNQNDYSRQRLILSLRMIGPSGASALTPHLIRCLDHPNPIVAGEAARTLQEFGATATSALPALTNALQRSTGSLHLTISNAIREIHSSSPLPRID